eukprot:TRINITY_DN668_c0_g1_i4.p1 TRINITY_DN668_c0_g1~~TRINITY_DN668_c0_g1_i4.p1  ORF type:complete len:478 (-),score=47.31 TRINITY_DN668_c0_g1_i4:8-1441(-)
MRCLVVLLVFGCFFAVAEAADHNITKEVSGVSVSNVDFLLNLDIAGVEVKWVGGGKSGEVVVSVVATAETAPTVELILEGDLLTLTAAATGDCAGATDGDGSDGSAGSRVSIWGIFFITFGTLSCIFLFNSKIPVIMRVALLAIVAIAFVSPQIAFAAEVCPTTITITLPDAQDFSSVTVLGASQSANCPSEINGCGSPLETGACCSLEAEGECSRTLGFDNCDGAYQGDGSTCGDSDVCSTDTTPLEGFWLFTEVQNAEFTATKVIPASDVCTCFNCGCPSGITCLKSGGINKIVFDGENSWRYFSNVQTGSDFNNGGTYRRIGSVVEFTQTRAWSCAHAKKKPASYDDVKAPVYSRFSEIGSNIRLWSKSKWNSKPAVATTEYILYAPVTEEDFYSKYHLTSCQQCSCICCGGGSCTFTGCTASSSCTVNCKDTENGGTCLCECAAECLEHSSGIQSCTSRRAAFQHPLDGILVI